MTRHDILFMVEYGNIHVFTFAPNRNEAIHTAANWIGANYSDKFIVTPLTKDGDRIKFDMTISI